MIVTYVPDDGDKLEFTFKPRRLLTTEAEAIEKITGGTYAEFVDALTEGSITARRALLWSLRKRNGEPEIRFRDVDFPIDALEIELDDEEKEQIRQVIRDDATLTDEDREAALAELGPEVATPDPKEASSNVDAGP